MNKMNPEVKALWTAALDSGEYRQGKGRLHDNEGGFCCLGVLCDVYRKETGQGEWKRTFLFHESFVVGEAEAHYDLPPAVIEWAGFLRMEAQKVEIDGEQGHLINFNDGRCLNQKSFAQLSQAIKEQL